MASGSDINVNILSDETFDKLCIICKRKDKNSEAERYCIDCQDYYCSKCVKVHEDVPLLRDHEIFGKDKFPSKSSSNLSIPNAPTEQCKRHMHKHVDMYCENHDTVGCSTCMAVDHGSCQGRFYISEYIQRDVSTAALEQELNLISKSLDEYKTFFQGKKLLLLEAKSKLLEDIKRFRKEINAKLDELEKTTLYKVQVEFDTLTKEAEKHLNLLKNSKVSVKSALNKFASSNISASQKFVNFNRGREIVDSVDEQLVDMSQHIKDITFEFRPYRKIQDVLVEETLGKLSQNNCQKSLLQTSGKGGKSVRLKSDKGKCYIVSACVLEYGTIILSDRGNRSLKHFDIPSLKVTEHYQLAGDPWQVCKIRRKEVAVCLSDIKTVEFVSIRNKMSKSNEIKTDFSCYGLAYNSDTLYISDSKTSVYVYNLSGIKLKQFSNDNSGNSLFSDIRCLAVNRSRIYVTDYNKGLVILDKDGGPAGEFDRPEIQSALGCSLTSRGDILVCDNLGSVLQYTEEGKFAGSVVKRNMTSLQTMMQTMYNAQTTIICTQQMAHLIVAGYENNLYVYNLLK